MILANDTSNFKSHHPIILANDTNNSKSHDSMVLHSL